MKTIYYKTETKEKAIALFEKLIKAGYKWCLGGSLKENNHWNVSGEDTFYAINPDTKEVLFGDYKVANKRYFRKTLRSIGL